MVACHSTIAIDTVIFARFENLFSEIVKSKMIIQHTSAYWALIWKINEQPMNVSTYERNWINKKKKNQMWLILEYKYPVLRLISFVRSFFLFSFILFFGCFRFV